MFGFLSCTLISFWNAFLFASFCLICWNSFICFIDIFLPVFFLETLSFLKLTSFSMFTLIHFKGFIMMDCPPFHLNLFISNLISVHRMINGCFMTEHHYNQFIFSFYIMLTDL